MSIIIIIIIIIIINKYVKNLKQFKTVFNGDTAYITQLKQQKSKRCYYVGARWHYGDVLQK